jgi:hypothetical protein
VWCSPPRTGEGHDRARIVSRRPWWFTRHRHALAQPLVRPGRVAVGDVLAERPPQVRPAEQQQVVEARAPDTPEEARAGGVLPGRAVGRAPLPDAGRRRDAGEGRPVLAVAIADELAGTLIERGGLAQLLGDPGVGRVARDADVDDPAGPQRHQEEGAQRPEEQIRDVQEVARPGLAGVVALECRPRLTVWARSWHLPQVLLAGPLADADVERQQLAADALGPPQRIVAPHLLDGYGHVKF